MITTIFFYYYLFIKVIEFFKNIGIHIIFYFLRVDIYKIFYYGFLYEIIFKTIIIKVNVFLDVSV